MNRKVYMRTKSEKCKIERSVYIEKRSLERGRESERARREIYPYMEYLDRTIKLRGF
jgi:hypothetical protein